MTDQEIFDKLQMLIQEPIEVDGYNNTGMAVIYLRATTHVIRLHDVAKEFEYVTMLVDPYITSIGVSE